MLNDNVAGLMPGKMMGPLLRKAACVRVEDK